MQNAKCKRATDTSESNKRYSATLIYKKTHGDRKSLWVNFMFGVYSESYPCKQARKSGGVSFLVL